MRNAEWVSLTDTQRGQLVCIWLLAADKNGELPFNEKTIKKLCFIESKLDMQVFIDNDFITACPACDANVTPSWRQHDAPDKSRDRIEKNREDPPYPPNLENDSFKKSFAEWEQHRKEIKKPLTKSQTKKQIKLFAEWGTARAVAAIDYTIRMGWQGIKEEDKKNDRSRTNGLQQNIRAGANTTTDWSKIGSTEYVRKV